MMISRIISGVSSIEVGIEKLLSVGNGIHQLVDIFFRGVEIEGGADGRDDAKIINQDFGAMLSASASDSAAIEKSGRVLGENVFDIESNDARFRFRVLKDRIASLRELFHCVFFQFFFSIFFCLG